jgi:hypothetical protein
MKRDVLGGGQPCGLAGRAAPKIPPTRIQKLLASNIVGAYEHTRNEVLFFLIFGRTLRIQSGFIYEAQQGAIL